jgi:hypothetical protein
MEIIEIMNSQKDCRRCMGFIFKIIEDVLTYSVWIEDKNSSD